MTRVLFFIESLSGGGAEKVLVTILKHFDYSRYDVTLMPLVDTGVLKADIDMSRLHYRPIISEGKSLLKRLWNKMMYKLIYDYLPCRLVNRWVIPQEGIDVYIAFTEGFSTKLLSYAPGKGIAWVHADLKTDPWTQNCHIYNNLEEEKAVYRKYSNVVCVSKAVEHVMTDYYHLHQTITIHNPINTEEILLKAQQPSNVAISSSFNMVSVGRLVPQKGFDSLITVVGRLKKEGKDIQLFIIGEGCERKHLESIIQQEKLQDVVHLMGYMSNPYSLMAKMDLFVCSSTAEGFSLVIAEAMTLGLPIISTRCAGPEEILEESRYGILTENNANALHMRLQQVIESPLLYEELKKKSTEKRKVFRINDTLDQIDGLIRN